MNAYWRVLIRVSFVVATLFILVSCEVLNKNIKDQHNSLEDSAIVMRLGHYATEDNPANLAALMFAKNVETRTGGKITVLVYADGQLGTPPELLEQNIIGTIDMSLPTHGALDKYSKKFATVMLPYAFKDYDQAHQVLDGPFVEWVQDDLEKQGLVYLSNWEYGFRNITNNVKVITNPEDIIGLRLRTPTEIQLQSAMESLGAKVTRIAFPDIYFSLKQGVVDGQENPLSVIYYNKLYEVQPYLAMTQHSYNSMVHVMSKKVWQKLTVEQQKIIKEESVNVGKWMREEVQKQEKEIISFLQDNGVIITHPNRDAFKSKMQYAYDMIGTYAGNNNVEYFLDMIKQSEKK